MPYDALAEEGTEGQDADRVEQALGDGAKGGPGEELAAKGRDSVDPAVLSKYGSNP